MDLEAEIVFRHQLEDAGEAAVRADFYGGGGLATGGEDRRKLIRQWLREKEQERQKREKKTDCYGRLTFWVALGALVVSAIGVVVTVFHS